MGYKVDNAIIMAAGLSSRFAPISYEKHKALLEIKGEILIERQIRQLREKGISNIILVVGYRKEDFYYLIDKYGVMIVENPDYQVRNNNSSIYSVRKYLRNSYICSADNYFTINPFETEVEEAYYAAMFSSGETKEWCLQTDAKDWITGVSIGGNRQWYMLGHTFWSEKFSGKFVQILEDIYEDENTRDKLWESIYLEYISQLKMKIRRYENGQIFEFDSLDELREFDPKYINNSGSHIMQQLAEKLECMEGELTEMQPMKTESGEVTGVIFRYIKDRYCFEYANQKLTKEEEERNE